MPTPPLHIDDDSGTQPLKHDGDVVFRGTIRQGRAVHVGGGLTVDGAIEPGMVTTGGPTEVAGAIIGSANDRLTVGGTLRCKSITTALVMCRAEITVADGVFDSRVTSVGRLDVTGGVIAGGDISANGGVVCRVLGDESGRQTVIEAGIGRAFKLLTDTISAQIEANKKRVADMRSASSFTPAQMKSMSAAEKERATEMLYEANEVDASTASLTAAFELRKRLILQKADPKIVVGETLHSGVVVRFGPIEAAVTTPVPGPLTIACRTENGVSEITLTTADGMTVVMPTRTVQMAIAA